MSGAKSVAVAVVMIIGIGSAAARADSICSVPVIVHADGSIGFDGARISDDAKLTALLVQYHKQNPKCAMRISGDGLTNFQTVGRVIFAMQKAGVVKVGFLTEPPK
jgi:biopolymer transport protein ExbD